MTDETCGHETGTGDPCQLPGSRADGRCHHHTDEADTDSGGRPTSFNDEDAQTAIDAARKGVSQAGCARAAGLPESTLRNWLDANEDFARSFAQARAEGEQRLVADGLTDPDTDSSMAKFLLASSFGYVKAEKRELEHSGEVDGFEFTINAGAED